LLLFETFTPVDSPFLFSFFIIDHRYQADHPEYAKALKAYVKNPEDSAVIKTFENERGLMLSSPDKMNKGNINLNIN